MALTKAVIDCSTGEAQVVALSPDDEAAFLARQAADQAAAAAAQQAAQQAAAQAEAATAAQRAADLAALQAAVAGTPLADPTVLAAFGRLVTGA